MTRKVAKFSHGCCRHCGTPRTVINPAWLREVRRSAGLPQRVVADALGFSVPYISDIEKGKRDCSLKVRDEYERIAREDQR